MTELEIYAPGLRDGEQVLRLDDELEPYRLVLRYKVDTHHDLVYFEFENPEAISLSGIVHAFERIGLSPRVVGEVPEGMASGTSTQRIY